MNQRTALLTGSLMAGLGVALGAFGAHALRDTLAASGCTETYEIAVRYQFYHALALLITGILMDRFKTARLRYAALCFTVGILIFSGSLYLLCITGITFLGAITPIGGTLFIIGWIIFFVAVLKKSAAAN